MQKPNALSDFGEIMLLATLKVSFSSLQMNCLFSDNL